jgi:hypothetical protein
MWIGSFKLKAWCYSGWEMSARYEPHVQSGGGQGLRVIASYRVIWAYISGRPGEILASRMFILC